MAEDAIIHHARCTMSQTKKVSTKQPVLRESAERIWLAGLGALALTEEQGTKLFKSLVKKGEAFDKATRSRLDKQIATVKDAPSSAMRRIEGSVEHTMTGMLHRFGIPTRREIHSLTRRVESLADSLEKKPTIRKRRTSPRAKLAPASAETSLTAP
jgi:poly(hydroxyalkanoate) granule-associated protein